MIHTPTNFETQVLQEDIMEFVNSIAKIVHTSVASHGGAANKNIGDAFLLVRPFCAWRLAMIEL
jgi:class 3 adenylate cyclase